MLDGPADIAPSPPPAAPPQASAPRAAPSPDGMEHGSAALAAVLAVLRRRRAAIVLCVLLVPALAALALSRITPRYTATTAVIYEPSEYVLRELQSILRADPTNDALMASQAEIIRGLGIAERLADRLKLEAQPEFNPGLRPISPLRRLWGRFAGPPPAQSAEDTRRDVIQAAQAAITVKPVKSSHVLEIGFTAADPALAARGANLAAELYIQDQLEAKITAVKRANTWLDSRIGDLRRDVRETEGRIASYRARQGLSQGVQAGLDTERASRLNTDLLAARNELAQLQSKLDAARGRAGATAQAAVAPSVILLRAKQAELSAQLQSLLTRLGPNHPNAMALRNQAADADRAVGAEIGRVVAATEAEMRAARTRTATLEQALKDAQTQQGQNAQAQIPLSAMERDAEASRALLQTVLEGMQRTAQQTAIERADARVISRAQARTSKGDNSTSLHCPSVS